MTFCAVSQLELTAGVGLGLAVGWVGIATVGVGAYLVGDRLLRLPRASTGSLIAATVVSNTGYFGLPLTAALLGGAALAPAIAFDALVSTPSTLALGFAVGAAFGTKAGDTPRERLRAYLVRNPPLLALVAGLLVPASAVPEVLVDAARLAAFALLPVGFFILGVHLRAERAGGALSFPPPLTRGLVAALGLRLAVAPAVMLAATLVIGGIPPRTCCRPPRRAASTAWSSATSSASTCGWPRARCSGAPRSCCSPRARRPWSDAAEADARARARPAGLAGPPSPSRARRSRRSARACSSCSGSPTTTTARWPTAWPPSSARCGSSRRGRAHERAARGARGPLRLAVHPLRRRPQGQPPAYVAAARPEHAEPLYERVCAALGAARGRFGAHMEVALVNDGPVTVLVELP
jgi:predicted permease